MKTMRIVTILSVILMLLAPAHTSKAQINIGNIANTVSGLTQNNGLAAGTALLGLYTQYKADGKLDLKNQNNIKNILTLATNIKGIDKLTEKAPFLKGLISGSKNLVNTGNQNTVMNSLTSLAGLDLSSLGTQAASSAVSGLLAKTGTTGSTTTQNQTTAQAASILSGLFSSLK